MSKRKGFVLRCFSKDIEMQLQFSSCRQKSMIFTNFEHAFCVWLGVRKKNINERQKDIIQKNVYADFFKDENFLGKSICNTCKTRLFSTESSSPRKLPDLKFQELAQNVRQCTRAKSLRAGAELECECEICRLGKLSKQANLKVGAALADPIASPFLGDDMKNLKKRGRPSDEVTKFPRCFFCHGEDKKGHNCTKDACLDNILESCSPGSNEILASEVIKSKMIKEKNRSVELKCKSSTHLQVTVNNCDHLAPLTPNKPTIKGRVSKVEEFQPYQFTQIRYQISFSQLDFPLLKYLYDFTILILSFESKIIFSNFFVCLNTYIKDLMFLVTISKRKRFFSITVSKILNLSNWPMLQLSKSI